MRSVHLLLVFIFFVQTVAAQKFDLVAAGNNVSIVYAADGKKLDSIAAHLLAADIEAVTGVRSLVTNAVEKVRGNAILIGAYNSRLIQSLNENSFNQLAGRWECFSHKVIKPPFKNIAQALVITGSDARGTAYGVFSLSEKIGVSPWYWWADAHPQKKQQLLLNIQPFISSPPSVKYRGIFINDEDWGLQPWAAKTFEPETGDIGPKTYAKVFELLLRLKANLIWPAMHESTKAFFHYPGNPKVADDYQIVVGSSHAEPMLRNNVSEWDVKIRGPFNYLTNKEQILKYWEERVKESSSVNAVYSLGIRGVHDSQMEGVKNLKEAVPVVEQVIREERDLLAKYINKNVTAVPQVLTPYKEVLEIYDNGLKVPEDVTLVWPDDNYGYIARLNNQKEKERKGGSGVYYHASYWGRPHDYLWLPSVHPGLMREEMMKAYEAGADRLWVVNVGDIKPIEYNMHLFLDMAYHAAPFKDSRYTKQHLQGWLTSMFGKENAGLSLLPVMWDYFQLAFERKPEFMGWSQTEPTTQTKYTDYNHFSFGDEAQKRIDKYSLLEAEVKRLRPRFGLKEADAFYQLVYYPIVGASWMNKKFLYRDKAYLYGKQHRLSAMDYAQQSKAAYDSIVKETEYFNNQLAGGKWRHIMSMKPRNLPVFQEPVLSVNNVDKASRWGIAPEGFDTSTVGEFVLPSFMEGLKEQYFVDVFLCDSVKLNWKAKASADWIVPTAQGGLLLPGLHKSQIRIWVKVNWADAPQKEQLNGRVLFSGSDGKEFVVKVHALRPPAIDLKNYKGFMEANGYVSLYAPHYSAISNRPGSGWTTVHDLGYTGTAMMTTLSSFPEKRLDTAVVGDSSAYLVYDFYTLQYATPTLLLYTLPSHPLNTNYSMRLAIAIDNGPVKLVDFKSNSTARTAEWKQNVLRNAALRKLPVNFLKKGKHQLKIMAVDPGVVLDRILIDLGGLKNAYSAVAETKKLANKP